MPPFVFVMKIGMVGRCEKPKRNRIERQTKLNEQPLKLKTRRVILVRRLVEVKKSEINVTVGPY